MRPWRSGGVYFSQKDLIDIWVERCWYPPGEYGNFRRNHEKGILPPASPAFDNDVKEHGMGCAICSEIWAMVAAGDPELAVRLCTLDGSIDHGPEAVAAEQMWAGLQSELFFESNVSNLRTLIDKHSRRLLVGSHIARGVALALAFFDQGLDVFEARKRLIARLGVPDACDTRVNVPFTIMALLYGKGDFKKTGILAMNIGFDTDCTGATALATLGLIYGLVGIPRQWVVKNGPNYVCDIDLRTKDDTSVEHVAERTACAGLVMLRARSRKCRIIDVPKEVVPIPVRRPEPEVRLSWDYAGLPSIALGEDREFFLDIHNQTKTAVSARPVIKGPVDQSTDLIGEACFYVLGTVVCDRKRDLELRIGSNDAIKIWCNGRLVHESDLNRAFCPVDRRDPVTFKKGDNRLVVKVLRRSEKLRFALQFAEQRGSQPANRHYVTDLTWRLG